MLSILAIARPAKEVVSHTFRVENFDLDGQRPLQRDKRVGCRKFFLSHRTSKIPSSLNKPVPYPDPRGFLEVFLPERDS